MLFYLMVFLKDLKDQVVGGFIYTNYLQFTKLFSTIIIL
jgi:hypothetical protein